MVCYLAGSVSTQCSLSGLCSCKPGVAGDKCDVCGDDYWQFPGPGDPGCQACRCLVEGSLGNRSEKLCNQNPMNV